MPEGDSIESFRQKAEACRQLADIEESREREALWIERAEHWEQLATKTERGSEPAGQAEV